MNKEIKKKVEDFLNGNIHIFLDLETLEIFNSWFEEINISFVLNKNNIEMSMYNRDTASRCIPCQSEDDAWN